MLQDLQQPAALCNHSGDEALTLKGKFIYFNSCFEALTAALVVLKDEAGKFKVCLVWKHETNPVKLDCCNYKKGIDKALWPILVYTTLKINLSYHYLSKYDKVVILKVNLQMLVTLEQD